MSLMNEKKCSSACYGLEPFWDAGVDLQICVGHSEAKIVTRW
jgi:hypothetical protein